MSQNDSQSRPSVEQGLTRRQVMATGAGFAAGCLLGFGSGARGQVGEIQSALRPPGALPGRDFLSACIRCGQCVEACPYDTLHLQDLSAGVETGSPTFTAATNPCWLCQGYDSLKCIDACPTHALLPVEDPRDVRIGLAIINQDTCLAYNNAMCRVCWHACPYPNEAIVYDSMLRPTVNPDVCTGCGLCEHGCPVEGKAIVIVPLTSSQAKEAIQTHAGADQLMGEGDS